MTIITIIICLWAYHLCLIFICNAYTMFIDPMCLKTLHYFQLNIIYALLILIFLFLIVSYAYYLFNESLFCSLTSIIPRMHSVPSHMMQFRNKNMKNCNNDKWHSRWYSFRCEHLQYQTHRSDSFYLSCCVFCITMAFMM